MAYAIMRMAKIKNSRALRLAVQHNTRERVPDNADPKMTSKNQSLGGSSDEVMSVYKAKLPPKIRANAVHAVEVVMTASPDFKGDWAAYSRSCNAWAKELFGEENLLSVAVHLDEKTPHIHAIFMPIKDGKLNASHFIGGPKNRLQELQDDFFKKVGPAHGLERGKSKELTAARHAHYSAVVNPELEKKLAAAEDIKKAIGISPQEIAALKTYKANWEKTTPAGLRVIAADIERSNCATVGEYSEKITQTKRVKQQGIKP